MGGITPDSAWQGRPAREPEAAVQNRSSPAAVPPKADYVVLLHGLARSTWSMKRLEWSLSRRGFRVRNIGYPSTRLSIQEVAERFLAPALHERTPDRQVSIHFVTHSLGGIVLRQYLRCHPLANLGRVVMLAPPNQGSELADRLKHRLFYRLLFGPSGQQLGTDLASLPRQLGPAGFELGVIAGDRCWTPCFAAWIPKPHDGTVSVQSTQLSGLKDFLVVHHSHTWMMWRKAVVLGVIQFLATGRFGQ